LTGRRGKEVLGVVLFFNMLLYPVLGTRNCAHCEDLKCHKYRKKLVFVKFIFCPSKRAPWTSIHYSALKLRKGKYCYFMCSIPWRYGGVRACAHVCVDWLTLLAFAL
jgi:hypothetical protein